MPHDTDRPSDEILYEHMRSQARRMLGRHRIAALPDTDSIVHSAWLRLWNDKPIEFQSQAEMRRFAATVLRNVLVDHIRRLNAQRRGGGSSKRNVDDVDLETPPRDLDIVLDIDTELTQLGQLRLDLASLIEQRFFAQYSWTDICTNLGITRQQARKDWYFARTWLRSRLGDH